MAIAQGLGCRPRLRRRAYRVREVAAMCAMSESAIYSEIRGGNLEAKMIGKRLIVPVDGLAEYMKRIEKAVSGLRADKVDEVVEEAAALCNPPSNIKWLVKDVGESNAPPTQRWARFHELLKDPEIYDLVQCTLRGQVAWIRHYLEDAREESGAAYAFWLGADHATVGNGHSEGRIRYDRAVLITDRDGYVSLQERDALPLGGAVKISEGDNPASR